MTWQDIVFSIGGIVFFAALIPTAMSVQKPHPSTSLMSGGVLIVFAATYWSLDLTYSTVITFFTALLWFYIAKQALAKKPKI